MKSKNLFIVLLIIITLLTAGCSNTTKSNTTNQANTSSGTTNSASKTAEAESAQSSSSQNSKDEDEEEEETASINIDWKTAECEWTDKSGYQFRATVKISPWILQSNTPVINTAWKEVSDGNKLPTIHDFGLKESKDNLFTLTPSMSSKSGRGYISYVTDMYYAVGEVYIENATEGWDITSANERAGELTLFWPYDYESGELGGQKTNHVAGKLFYSNAKKNFTGMVHVNASMSKNSWGPIPFILAHSENISPKTPDGIATEYLKNGYVKIFGGDEVNVTNDIEHINKYINADDIGTRYILPGLYEDDISDTNEE